MKPWLSNQLKAQLRAVKKLERDDLDLANAGQWPIFIKVLSLLLLLSSVIFTSHWLLINRYQEVLAKVKQEQQQLLEDYQQQAFQTTHLASYQQQTRIMEETLVNLLAFLPGKNEVPRLLDDIQRQANQQQLEILALNLKKPIDQNFYTQLPFEIKVRGNFHQLTNFIAGISSFDRLVTLHNFSLIPEKPNTAATTSERPTTSEKILTLQIEAQTYRYDPSQSNSTITKRSHD